MFNSPLKKNASTASNPTEQQERKVQTLPAVPVLQNKPVQKADAEERLPLQGKFPVQLKGDAPAVNSILEEEEDESGASAQLKKSGEEELPVQGKFAIQKQGINEEKLPVEGKFIPPAATQQQQSTVQRFTPQNQPVQKKENNTGLPDNLKEGVENLSGIAMDDVSVHYNSDKPAEVQAFAYAQGTDIHVAPGQEKHLPHEAWHVVQQKQGRVQPTMQMKQGVPVNDDKGLESEADVMGGKALKDVATTGTALLQEQVNTDVLQGAFLDIESKNFEGYIIEQEKKQGNIKNNDGPFTTVGFEHEFTQTKDKNKLAGISHLELAKSKALPFTGLPFILETDAANALELVCPPFLIKTLEGTLIPDPVDVETLDNMIRSDLEKLSSGTIGGLVDGFRKIGIDFEAVKNLTIKSKNLSHKSEVKDYSKQENSELEFESLKSIEIKPSEKGGGITSQVNFATDAKTFDDIQKINQEKKLNFGKETPGFNPKAILATIEEQIKKNIGNTGIKPTNNLNIFINQLARTLSGQFATPSIEAVRKTQEELYKGTDLQKKDEEYEKFQFSAYLSSAVKDVHGIWIKDSLMNIGLGLLNYDEWQEVKKLITNQEFISSIYGLKLPEFKNINGFEADLQEGNKLISNTLEIAKNEIIKALETIGQQIELIEKDGRPSSNLAIVPVEPVGFMEHNEGMIGPRQDTYIDPRKAQIPGIDKRLHVAETRKDGIETLYKIGIESGKLSKETLEKLAKEKQEKIQKIKLDIEELEQKMVEIDKKVMALKSEYTDKENQLETINKVGYKKSLEDFTEAYKKQNENKEPGKNQIKKFEQTFDKEKTKLETRLETIQRMLKSPEINTRLINIDKDIKKKVEEGDAYIAELNAIEMQLKNK